MSGKCNTYCCVYGCNSKKGREKHIHFHNFPQINAGLVNITNKFGIVEQMDRRKAWIYVLLMGKKVSTSMKVCSKHFAPQDYKIPEGLLRAKTPRLKSNAVPSLNLPQKSHQRKEEQHKRMERYSKRQKLRDAQLCSSSTEIVTFQNHNEDENEIVPHNEDEVVTREHLSVDEETALDALLNLSDYSIPQKFDKCVGVSSGDFQRSFLSTIKSDTMLNSISGIPNHDTSKTFETLINKYYPHPRTYKINVSERILLVFMKLKLAITFKVLSFFFEISPTLCSNIFKEYVKYLSEILKSCITWPSIEECRNNLPTCFKDFCNVRVILDCMEIPVQKPKCLCCRVRTYSHYKGRHTIKVMTGVSPGALITFVSKCYGGRSSDKAIFEQSDIISKLEPHVDAVMVDKGFLIEKNCNDFGIQLIRPSFLRNKHQFNAEESLKNKNISKARVHVERANQRIRLFDLLNKPLPWTLVNCIDDIITICCGMVNLQQPLLAVDKFQ